jgi:hypothetical protein
VVSTLDLVGQEQRQEGGGVELLGPRELEPRGQGRQRLAELEPLEQAGQSGIDAHGATSASAARSGAASEKR